ncbi:acylphosphatase [Candidatus Pacearchaeota archaeon]|nr:acylphosphatase [Candidatus Pacearchaeota archaeon]
MKTLKIFIIGNVQGVFFRKFIEDNAKKLNVRGYVRNLQDGKVEVIAEGRDENVKKLLELCKQGSRQSEVKDVKFEEIKYQGFDDFRISYL